MPNHRKTKWTVWVVRYLLDAGSEWQYFCGNSRNHISRFSTRDEAKAYAKMFKTPEWKRIQCVRAKIVLNID